MLLGARTAHLLSFPADKPLPIDTPGSSSSRYPLGLDRKGKGKEREKVFEGMVWDVPGFHDEVFWDCKLAMSPHYAESLELICKGKDSIVGNEMQILKRLGFNMQVSFLCLWINQSQRS